eukprot:4919342-Amphidinium_carterae.1
MTITNLLDATVKHLDARYELASTPVGIYLPDVQQFVLLMRPEYMANPAAEALDIAILVNKFFSTRRAELTTYGISPTFLWAAPCFQDGYFQLPFYIVLAVFPGWLLATCCPQ